MQRSRYHGYLDGDKCSQASISVLRDHWNACCRETGCTGSTVERKNAMCYLDKHVAHGDFVTDVLQAVNRQDASTLSQDDFFLATYLLLMAVRKAQESLFMDPDEDASDCIDQKRMVSGVTNVQRKLSHVSAELSSALENNDGDGGWKIRSEVIPRLDLSNIQCEDTSGPLGQGVLSMRGSGTMRHNGFGDDAQDPWNAFDDTVDHSARSRSTWARDDGRISLSKAFKKLVGPLPGSTILPLTDAEKAKCLESFKAKGYDQSGGMPIRDAIEMYHALETRHVHFSKVWALVDPNTVCKIDERCFCAFIAIVQSVTEQGDGIKLPKSLSDEDISRLILEPVPGQTSSDQLRLNLGKALQNDNICEGEMWSAAFEDIETPRTCFESEYSSDDDSIGGASLVSRVPSIAGSFRSMSFNIKSMLRSVSRVGGRDLEGKSQAERLGHLPNEAREVQPASKLDTAVWREQSGPGHDHLHMKILYSALGTRREFDKPFVSIELRDKIGRLLELPIDTAPGIHNRDRGTLKFSNQSKTLTSLLMNVPSGSSLFFAIKQWKAKRNKMSTIAWSVVDFEMICDVGNLSCRVREGKLALPLFKKPMDLSRQKAKRLNSRHPCLYIEVEGISEDSTQ